MLFRQFYAPTGGVANAPVLNGLSTMVKSPLENWAPTCLIPQIVCNLFGGRYRHRQLNDRDEVGGFCVAVSDNAAFVASYYYQEAGLAARDDLANGVWYAPDIRMKVPNGTPVSEADLREVLKRRLPWTNETGPAKRESKQKTPTKKGSASIETTSARDISFSVPKSVSLVWALGTPDIRMKIEEAQHRAVKRAMDLFFQNVALERIGNSKEQKTRPAIAFCALFLHGTSRNAKRDDGKLHPDPCGAGLAMIVPGVDLKIYMATRPVDFRRGLDGLAATAQEVLGLDPYSGAAVVFRAKRADRIKILVWDRTGLVLVHKRLEGSKFVWPQVRDGVMRMSPAMFAALFEGLDWRLMRPERARRPQLAG